MAGPKILIVDDEAHIRNLVELKLKGAGYEVRSAANVSKALEAAVSFGPDLIVSDFEMPGEMDGVDLAKVIRDQDRLDADAKRAWRPVIILSGAVSVGEKLSSTLGHDHDVTVITKPFSPRKLLQVLEELLGRVEGGGPNGGGALP